MAKISFIHISDIHFRKNSGNVSDIDENLRQAILTDLNINAKTELESIKGILVTGDIAYSGAVTEYDKAKIFLKEITDTFGIEQSSVFCVPGNHDVDRNISSQNPYICDAQRKLDSAETLDDADKIFDAHINLPGTCDLIKHKIKVDEFISAYIMWKQKNI